MLHPRSAEVSGKARVHSHIYAQGTKIPQSSTAVNADSPQEKVEPLQGKKKSDFLGVLQKVDSGIAILNLTTHATPQSWAQKWQPTNSTSHLTLGAKKIMQPAGGSIASTSSILLTNAHITPHHNPARGQAQKAPESHACTPSIKEQLQQLAARAGPLYQPELDDSSSKGLDDPAALLGAPLGVGAGAVPPEGELALALLAPLGLDEVLHGVVVGSGDAVAPVHDEDHRHVLVVHGDQALIWCDRVRRHRSCAKNRNATRGEGEDTGNDMRKRR